MPAVPAPPPLTSTTTGDRLRITAVGSWTAPHARALEAAVETAAAEVGGKRGLSIDATGVREIDTFGAWLLERLVRGEAQPDGGEPRIGDTVQLAYVDQSRGGLDASNTVWKEISGNQDTVLLGKREVNSRQYVSWFNFRGSDQQKRVSDLSGGERNRVHLAKLLKSGGNLLLLDEPTNDLDVDTLRALEDALLDFAGCAVVITHDRWFLDRIATHILAFEGDSQTTWFEGSWAEYAEWVVETRGAEALEPHRIAYKPLARP